MRGILVVGPGRCGTSAVARVLHDSGVFMGWDLVPGNASNLAGHSEDVDFHNINQRRLDGRFDADKFERHLRFLIGERKAMDIPWGVKDPRIANLIEVYRKFDWRYIRCWRSREAVVASMQRWYGWSWLEAERVRDYRENMLDKFLPEDVLEIDVDRGIDGEAIRRFVDA